MLCFLVVDGAAICNGNTLTFDHAVKKKKIKKERSLLEFFYTLKNTHFQSPFAARPIILFKPRYRTNYLIVISQVVSQLLVDEILK